MRAFGASASTRNSLLVYLYTLKTGCMNVCTDVVADVEI